MITSKGKATAKAVAKDTKSTKSVVKTVKSVKPVKPVNSTVKTKTQVKTQTKLREDDESQISEVKQDIIVDRVIEDIETIQPKSDNKNIENSNLEQDLILNEDILDLLEGMTEKLEQTTDMAEKIKLHTEIKETTLHIKNLIDALIQDVDSSKIMVDPASVYPDELDPTGDFDVMSEIHSLETDLEQMDDTDDLRKKISIYANLQRKCEVLKRAADQGELIIRKCN